MIQKQIYKYEVMNASEISYIVNYPIVVHICYHLINKLYHTSIFVFLSYFTFVFPIILGKVLILFPFKYIDSRTVKSFNVGTSDNLLLFKYKYFNLFNP